MTTPSFLYRWSPDLWLFYLWFFNFKEVWKRYAFSRHHILNLDFWSFPGLTICSRILSCDAGWWQLQWDYSAPRQPFNHQCKETLLYSAVLNASSTYEISIYNGLSRHNPIVSRGTSVVPLPDHLILSEVQRGLWEPCRKAFLLNIIFYFIKAH